ncbi:hypothetical protein D3C73_1205190 [compost metagenome]
MIIEGGRKRQEFLDASLITEALRLQVTHVPPGEFVSGVPGKFSGLCCQPEGLVKVPRLPFGACIESGNKVGGQVRTLHVPIIHVIAEEKLV